MAESNDRIKRAANLVAQAITELAAMGADTPSSAREALSILGTAYSTLGWADPDTPYSAAREFDRS